MSYAGKQKNNIAIKIKEKKKLSSSSAYQKKCKPILYRRQKLKRFLHYSSLLISTFIFIIMTIDIAKPDLIRPKKVSDFSTQNIEETKLEYFYRIGKSEKQIQVNNFTDIAVDISKFIPIATSVIIQSPIMYITYAGAYVVETLTGSLLRVVVKAPRPDDFYNKTSFPSGHTMYIFSIATILLIALKNKFSGIVMFCFAVLIAYCRILANRHFITDVIAGATIGCSITIFCYFIVLQLNSILRIFKSKYL